MLLIFETERTRQVSFVQGHTEKGRPLFKEQER